MKTKKEELPARSVYKRYTTQFKEQALERADLDGRSEFQSPTLNDEYVHFIQSRAELCEYFLSLK